MMINAMSCLYYVYTLFSAATPAMEWIVRLTHD